MPTYTYRCPECGDRDIQHSIHAPALTECGDCGSEIRRVIGNPEVRFQGGREFFRNTTVEAEVRKTMEGVRASGGTPERLGKRWI